MSTVQSRSHIYHSDVGVASCAVVRRTRYTSRSDVFVFVCFPCAVGALPECLTDGTDVMSELEQQEMQILQEVLKYVLSVQTPFPVVLEDINV